MNLLSGVLGPKVVGSPMKFCGLGNEGKLFAWADNVFGPGPLLLPDCFCCRHGGNSGWHH